MSENSQPVQKISKQDANPTEVQNAAEDDPGLKPHPLMMPVVLRCLFDNMGKSVDIKDLKSCRLVNSTWNETASYRLNQICRPVAFFDWGNMEGLKSCIAASNSGTNRWRFPLTKFEILPTTTKMGIEEFLPMIAPWATEIILFSCPLTCPENDPFSKPSPFDNLEFPSLKSLTFSIDIISQDDSVVKVCRWRQIGLSFASKILQNSSNLEHLIVHESPRSYLTDDDEIKTHVPIAIQILNTMETMPNGKLRVLKFKAPVENSHFRRLTDLQLRLTYLRLDFHFNEEDQINPEIIRDFLQTQSETLVKLKLRNLGESWMKEVLFPSKIEKLKFIEIGICFLLSEELKPVTFPGLNLNKQMPVLAEIKFKDYLNAGWMEFFSHHLTNQPVTSVKRVRFKNYFPTVPVIRLGMRCFPNAKYTLR